MKTEHFGKRCILLVMALVASLSCVSAKSGPITVCYMDSNVSNLESAGKYTLASTGENVFDIAIIFAANVNYNTTTRKAVLSLNSTVQEELPRAKNLQQKGIKVLLSILGNHQGAGVCNFPSYEAAYDFATQCKAVVDQYGLDGIDIDDEYAKYGTNGTGQPNAYSFVYFVTALRELMPDKIISFYYIGPATSRQSYNGVTVGSKINYSWQAYYGSYSAPNVPGLGKSQLGPAAVWINNTATSTAANNAQRTVNDGYGVYLTYNLPDTDQSAYISSFTEKLYGSRAVFGDGDDNNTLQAATMTSPAPGSTLSGSSVTFQWTNSAQTYWIDWGSSAGSWDLYRSGELTSTSHIINNLPTDGRTIYIRLSTVVNGQWQSNNYTYKASAGGSSTTLATMTSPANGSTLSGSSQTFRWDGNASHYTIYIGTSKGKNDIVDTGPITGSSKTLYNLPTNGRTLYVRLWTYKNGWDASNTKDYTFTASGGGGDQVAPIVNITATSSSSISLSWNNTGAQSYYIYTLAPGGSWTLAAQNLTSTSHTLTGLKADTTYTIDVYAEYGSTQKPKRITAKTAADGGTLTNVAKGKPFAVSSTWGSGYEGWRANDGNSSTRWASGQTGGNRWIYFDLQKTYNIQAVTLKWDPAYGRNYTIDVWNGSSWVTIKSVYNNRSQTNNITGLSSNARYIRMNCSSAPYSHISVWEFEVYGK